METGEQAVAPQKPMAISLRNLWVMYGKFEAVKGISLDIPQGEVFGFIGPNGAGKSSTFRVLAPVKYHYSTKPQFHSHIRYKSLALTVCSKRIQH